MYGFKQWNVNTKDKWQEPRLISCLLSQQFYTSVYRDMEEFVFRNASTIHPVRLHWHRTLNLEMCNHVKFTDN